MKMVGEYPDRITEKFVGKNIFITGGTGFIGKVLIEKILRLCPEIGCIFLLIRSKKGKDPQSRVRELLANPVFDTLKSMYTIEQVIKKCKVIEGDISEINLAIKEADRKLLTEKIDYIYHIAATVRFDEPLKSALLMNTRGTKYMLELAKDCEHLQLFCHVSTAYVHPTEKLLEEKPYPPSADPHTTIENLQNIPLDIVESMKSQIMGNLPNTYTFTKSLSEALVVEQMDKLPIIIVRPSVVIPMWKEPQPGWGENINGPMGLLIGAGKGVVRSMYCSGDCYADFLPVDVVVNGLCATTFDYLTYKDSRIYNFTSSDELKYTWKDIVDTGRKVVTTRIPFNYAAWYPGGSLTTNRFKHYFAVIFFHLLPALFIDTILFCFGQKPVLLRVQKKIWKGSELLEFYASNQWDFVKHNALRARDRLNPREIETYYINKNGFDFEEYIYNAVLGARRYIMKEPDHTIPAAKRHLKMMRLVDIIFKILFVISIIYFIYQKIIVS